LSNRATFSGIFGGAEYSKPETVKIPVRIGASVLTNFLMLMSVRDSISRATASAAKTVSYESSGAAYTAPPLDI
jgi:hypothetical protein